MSLYYGLTKIAGKGDTSELDNYIPKNTGTEGDVVYRVKNSSSSGITYKDQKILDQQYYICETEEEFEKCKGEVLTFKEIFDTWTKFGHYAGKQYGIDDDYYGGVTPGYSNWSYNEANKTIKEAANSTDFTGFVSKNTHGDYSFTVRCYSTDGDDDFNGLVAAFATDESGRQHTLSFIRSPNNSNTETTALTHHWYCVLDLDGYNDGPFTPGRSQYGSKLIKNSSLNSGNEPSGAWSTYKDFGVLIRVERQGNVFKAYTSSFSNTALDESSLGNEMVIDLDEVINDETLELTDQQKAALRLFIDQPVSIGYCTHSQPASMYENWSMPETDRFLIKLSDKTVWKYDYSVHDWVQDTSIDCLTAVGKGRLSNNKVTGKTFYVGMDSITKITGSMASMDFWMGTIAEYNALTTKDSSTIYFCSES